MNHENRHSRLSSGVKTARKVRPDRDRRVRQSEKLARVLKVLLLIHGKGQWNAKAIARELGCSERTIYRDLEVLEFAGVPWFFDKEHQAYRIRAGYKLSQIFHDAL